MTPEDQEKLEDLRKKIILWLYDLKKEVYSWEFHDQFKCCKRLVNQAIYSLLVDGLIKRDNSKYMLTNKGIGVAINLKWQGK